METNETEFSPGDHANGNGKEISFEVFDFENLDRRIHPDAAPHSANDYREAGRAFISFYDQVLMFILTSENPRLAAWVVAMASGRSLITDGISQKELADRMGITKAAVSKCVKKLQARFGNRIEGIEPMPGQRPQEACRNFARIRTDQLSPPPPPNEN